MDTFAGASFLRESHRASPACISTYSAIITSPRCPRSSPHFHAVVPHWMHVTVCRMLGLPAFTNLLAFCNICLYHDNMRSRARKLWVPVMCRLLGLPAFTNLFACNSACTMTTYAAARASCARSPCADCWACLHPRCWPHWTA